MDSIELNDWKAVTNYVEQGFLQVPNWMFEHIVQHGNYYPAHAFSKGQLASKSWLLNQLYFVNSAPINATIAVLGSWVGALNPFLQKSFSPERVYGFDMDADAIEKSERLNQQYVQDSWKFKGVVADVSMMQTCDMKFETGGELIQCKPDWVINTSCEHMDNSWFETADSEQLIIMQTNDSEEFDGHINPCYTASEMQAKYPLSDTLYIGKMVTPVYTRYMQIGYK